MQAALDDIARTCTEVGGTPALDRAVVLAELDGQQGADHVVFTGWARCDGAASVFGDREKGVELFTGLDAGTRPPFAGTAYDVRIERDGGRDRVWLTLAGPDGCGTSPAADFASENFCERPVTFDGSSKAFVLAPTSEVRMIR